MRHVRGFRRERQSSRESVRRSLPSGKIRRHARASVVESNALRLLVSDVHDRLFTTPPHPNGVSRYGAELEMLSLDSATGPLSASREAGVLEGSALEVA